MVYLLRLCMLAALTSLPTLVVLAQDPQASLAHAAAGPRLAAGDLDGDGRADVVLADLDGDGMMDIVPLSRSYARHDTVRTSVNNVRGAPADEIGLGDLDGDGREELALLATSGRTMSLHEDNRPLLAVIRGVLAAGPVLGVAELIDQGWLAQGAAGGGPLAHVNAGGPAVGGGDGLAPIPLPYPDPENNPSAGASGGGTGGGAAASSGNDPGTATGTAGNRPRRLPPALVNPGSGPG